MSRNGSGTYALPAGNPVVSGTFIESAWANATMGDIETELTDSLSRSGKGGMLAALRITDGTIGAPGLGFTDEAALGLYRSAANTLDFVQGAARKMRMSATQILVNPTAGVADFQVISANNGAKIRIKSGNSTADEGAVELSLTGDVLTFRVVNDDGTAGQTIFSVDLADDSPIVWGRNSTPMTAEHDIIVGGTAGAPARLALGATNGMVLGRVADALGYFQPGSWEFVDGRTLATFSALSLGTMEAGYIYRLIAHHMSSNVTGFIVVRLHNDAGVVVNSAGSYIESGSVVNNTGINSESTTQFYPYNFSGITGMSDGELATFDIMIYDAMDVGRHTSMIANSMTYINNSCRRGHSACVLSVIDGHNQIQVATTAGVFDSGSMSLYRIKETA